MTTRPIYILGAGGIVNDAHLPAYKIAGYNVAGIFDANEEKAIATAHKFSIPAVFDSLDSLVKSVPANAVFDVALPASAFIETLKALPNGASVLLQKPMGNTLEEAKQIRRIVHEKKMLAAVNFQLRYAPFVTMARSIISHLDIGEICDVEFNINVYTPWHLWDFLYSLPRVEILYHSIHYIDLVRSFLGNPKSVYAKTTKHPRMKELASVRSNIIMDYGEMISANIIVNHCHNFGTKHQCSNLKIEGTRGAINIQMGLNMNYPQGMPDVFEYVILEEGKEPQWKTLPVNGTWLPHAFIYSMEQLLLAADGKIPAPDNSVDDCIYTMACVEAAYASSAKGGVNLEDVN
ncbi:Gfo/Idh/MocA family protein [Pinibacter aurantiacus]|uniref:Gfo/Idh/MocA family oxidoreductase n=1 Tax=Pinibacter aurantiacus TaxID=2851599 RepID=A0A9E2SD38_9BACT|nr:Gfo/Idh/MocA family oxidoreductase [Pinibacter aurantiacus]MBV4357640.1 Gfo/Idh/MocA family oxidoreductase [Pinibacter aurantiacus]